ncbi:MAG: biopolymer transporter ExbD [Myxococcaceae bacterium]
MLALSSTGVFAQTDLHIDDPSERDRVKQDVEKFLRESNPRPAPGTTQRAQAQDTLLLPADVQGGAFTVAILFDGSLNIGGADVTEEELARKADIAFLMDPEKRVVIAADKDVTHARVIQVIELLKNHGAHKFALAVGAAPLENIDAGPVGDPNFDAGQPEPEDAGSTEPPDAGPSDVAPYVEPPKEDFHRIVEINGYIDLRGTFTRSKPHALIPTDTQPEVGLLGELNGQLKVTYSPKRFVYADVSLLPQAGWIYRGEDKAGNEVSVASASNPSTQPISSINELYVLHEFFPELNVLVGKKRVVWGSGQAFNPTDLLNLRKDPTDPTFLRTGVWMARVEVPLEKLTFTALFSPSVLESAQGIPYQFVSYPSWDKKDDQLHYMAALRAYALIGDADVNVMAFYGNKYNDDFTNHLRVGGSFSRYFFKDYELHTEFIVGSGSARSYVNGACVTSVMAAFTCAANKTSPLGATRLDDPTLNARILIGTRRQFDDDSFLSVEYLYQSDGFTKQQFQDYVNAADLLHQARAAGIPLGGIPGASNFGQPATAGDGVPQRFSFDPLRQHYAFITFNKPRIKDDFTAQLVTIADLSDLSTIWNPSLSWSATEWLTITALGFIPAPGPDGLAAKRVSNGKYVSEYTLLPLDYRFFLELRLFY